VIYTDLPDGMSAAVIDPAKIRVDAK